MTFNGITALILRYFTELHHSNWRQTYLSAKYRLPVTFGQNLPTQQSHGLCDS